MEESNTIWRYFDLPKFCDLIQSSTLFFERADKLKSFDRYEGRVLTEKQEFSYQNDLKSLDKSALDLSSENFNMKYFQKDEDLTFHYENEKKKKKMIFINCWHRNKKESYAMWKVYAMTFGIAIKTKIQYLKKCFSRDFGIYNNNDCFASAHKAIITPVRYYDSEIATLEAKSIFCPYIRKRKEFEYENEIRCLILVGGTLDVTKEGFDIITPDNIKEKVNLNTLIEEVYVSPFAPVWFYNIVKDLCEKYEINKKVIQSNI